MSENAHLATEDHRNEMTSRKAFVEPLLVRQASLPKVTAGFVGTFNP